MKVKLELRSIDQKIVLKTDYRKDKRKSKRERNY